MLSFEMHFYQTFGFSMYQHLSKKNGPFVLFWFRESSVIIVTFLPSLESADECVNASLFHVTQQQRTQNNLQLYVLVFEKSGFWLPVFLSPRIFKKAKGIL